MWENFAMLAGGIVIGAVLGVTLDEVIRRTKEAEKEEIPMKKALEACFGEPMYAETLTLEEIRNWISKRNTPLHNGQKVVIAKATSDNLKTYGLSMDPVDDLEHYLFVVIVDESASMISPADSLLIKYERLDTALEERLDPGNGVLIVRE